MGAQQKFNPIEVAINDFTQIQDLLGRINEEKRREVVRRFRARCREIPSLIESLGLIPTLSFCYAKAGDGTYRGVVEALEGGKLEGLEDPESAGYALYLYYVLETMRRLGVIGEGDVKQPVEALKKMFSSRRAVAALIKQYVVQLKRLAEAVFEEETG